MAEVINTRLRVLIVVTSAGEMGPGGKATGVWLEELAVPYWIWRGEGLEVEIVSVEGGALPVDPSSLKPRGENPETVERFLDDEYARRVMDSSGALSDVDTGGFDAVFFPGGHGTMWDLPENEHVGRTVAEFLAAGKPVGAVCHGPAALVSARYPDGTPVVAGRRVSGFTDSEERAMDLLETVPFALETRLRELGADVQTAPDFQPFAIRDGILVTGQNPASSEKVALLMLEALADRKTSNTDKK